MHKGLFGFICFITQFPSLITQIFTPVWHHHPIFIIQYFSHYLWVHTCQLVQLFFFCFLFFFWFLFSIPKLIEAKNKINPELKTEPVKKKNRTANPREEMKKRVKCGQKVRLVLFVGPLCVINYNITIELWVMETENSQNVFSVSITYNLKIRELSDGNRVIVCQTAFLLWVPPFLSYELWKLRIKLPNLPIQTPP